MKKGLSVRRWSIVAIRRRQPGSVDAFPGRQPQQSGLHEADDLLGLRGQLQQQFGRILPLLAHHQGLQLQFAAEHEVDRQVQADKTGKQAFQRL